MSTERVLSLILASGLRRVEGELIGLIRPAVAATAAGPVSGTALPSPDEVTLMAGTERPTWHGGPIPLLASVRLADLRGLAGTADLPRDGRLSFFFDDAALEDYPPDPASWRVVHRPALAAADPLPSVLATPDLEELRLSERLTLPPLDSDEIERLGLDEAESDLYCELLDAVDAAFGLPEGGHQFLGHPYQVQGDLLTECLQDTGRGPDREDWQLLLQLGESKGVSWGDAGMLYFLIPRQALRERDFSAVHVVMQCA